MNNDTSISSQALRPLYALDGYRQFFMDVDLWRPYVKLACQQQDLESGHKIRGGLEGSFPTFIVDDRWVVKFFGPLFEGKESYAVELAVNQQLSSLPDFAAPTLVAHGELFAQAEDWPWPYLIMTFLPGTSIGEIREAVPFSEQLALAQQLGSMIKKLHQLTEAAFSVPELRWQYYVSFLQAQHANCQQNQRTANTLPAQLLAQLDSYLLPFEQLLAQHQPPHLIHADLTADHILGRLEDDRWITSGLIDFGDAMIADLGYELIALHLDLFGCDKRLLKAFLEAYGFDWQAQPHFPQQMMNLTLLHRFDVLEPTFERFPQTQAFTSLAQLAAWLWDINAPQNPE